MNKKFWVSITTLSILLSVFLVFFVALNYPFQKSKIVSVVPTDKREYYPGDRIGFELEICLDTYKFDEVTYQLESDPGSGEYYYMVLGSFKSVGIPGCWQITDLNVRIPDDFFNNSKTHQGRHRLFVISTYPQNEFKHPTIYQSDWFEVKKSNKIIE